MYFSHQDLARAWVDEQRQLRALYPLLDVPIANCVARLKAPRRVTIDCAGVSIRTALESVRSTEQLRLALEARMVALLEAEITDAAIKDAAAEEAACRARIEPGRTVDELRPDLELRLNGLLQVAISGTTSNDDLGEETAYRAALEPGRTAEELRAAIVVRLRAILAATAADSAARDAAGRDLVLEHAVVRAHANRAGAIDVLSIRVDLLLAWTTVQRQLCLAADSASKGKAPSEHDLIEKCFPQVEGERRLIVRCPGVDAVQIVRRLATRCAAVVRDVLGTDVELVLRDVTAGSTTHDRHRNFTPDPRFTFESFVPTPSTRPAFEAALAVADGGSKAADVLILHGDQGVGKTHLLHAICDARQRVSIREQIRCVNAGSFIAEFRKEVARNTKEEFRSFYQACAGLLIDNMEYIEGDDQALTEVCRTIEALRDRGALVVVAMRSGDIVADFEKAIKWRELGHVQKRSIAPLKPLDQKKIVKSRIVGLLGVLEPQHIERVCSAVGSRIDDLDDALRTLLRKRSSEDKRKPIHHSELIAQLTLTPTFIGPFALVKFVSKELKVPEEVIRGDSRSPDALRGREFAALLADKLNKSARWLRPAIGKDHSTVARSLARAKARYEKDSTFRLEFDRIEARYVSMRTPTGRVASLPT